jgi:hypothetical protein
MLEKCNNGTWTVASSDSKKDLELENLEGWDIIT